MKLLKRDSKLYGRQIKILMGEENPSRDDVLVLISLLGRLRQQDRMGPISTFRQQKLNPKHIKKHTVNLNYINETIYTIESYRQVLNGPNANLLKVKNITYEIPNKITNTSEFQKLLLPDSSVLAINKKPVKVSTSLITGDVMSPNYIESFFRKFANLDVFKDILPMFNSNEDMVNLISYSKRFNGSPKEHDFMIAGKVRNILGSYKQRY